MAGTKVATQDPGTKLFLPPCRVCGDKAAGFHYGVNTCEACKGFFHRSLRRYKEYKCRANRSTGYCEYKPGKRKSCQYCRYQRCLNAGMSKDAIKTGRYTYIKRTEDTQEIKRLQDIEHLVNPDGQVVESMLVSSAHSNLTSRKCDTAELDRKDCYTDTYMEVDFNTSDEFVTLSVTESDLSSSSSEFSSSEAIAITNSLNSDSRKCNIYRKSSTNGCHDNKAHSTTKNLLSSIEDPSNRLSENGNVISTKESLFFNKMELSASPDSYSDQGDNLILCTSESEFTLYLESEDSGLASHTFLEALDQINSDGSSIIRNLLSNSNSGDIKNHPEKSNIDSLKSNSNKKYVAAAAQKSNASHSMNSSLYFSSSEQSGSSSLNVKNTSRSNGRDLLRSSFDLFPDISFCLDGHQASSPTSLSDESSISVMTPSGLLSPLTSQSPESDSVSPVPSPGVIMLNMDSGKRLKVIDDLRLVTDLCHTPESNYPNEEVIMVPNEDNITLQIMEEYTQGLDLIVDSPTQVQVPTPVQTLLISPSPQDLRSVTPQSSSCSDMDDLSVTSPTTKLMNGVKNLKLSDICELYSDMDAVIAILMASHKENIGDFKYLSKEEMTAQQEAHCESCRLKKQTFGDLGFLPDQEYDDIYSVTGIDVDNRRMIIQKYLCRMEMCVRGLVQFAKSIPGFSILDINTQVELIKLARSEIAIFTVYPTVNLELGVTLGLTGETWACQYDMGYIGYHIAIADYMTFCDKLQKMAPTQEEEVLLKAILVVSTDRDSSISSPLAEAIRWQLILCLKHCLQKQREQPSLFLARYILALTQSRTVAEKFKDFFRNLKMQKYSSIEQNPLMWELFSGILQEKEAEANWEKLCQHIGEGKAGMWSPCLLG